MAAPSPPTSGPPESPWQLSMIFWLAVTPAAQSMDSVAAASLPKPSKVIPPMVNFEPPPQLSFGKISSRPTLKLSG